MRCNEDADDPIENEHHVVSACAGYVHARQLFQDFFKGPISTVGHFLSQPNPNHVYTKVRSQASHMGQIDQKYAHKTFKEFARQSACSPS